MQILHRPNANSEVKSRVGIKYVLGSLLNLVNLVKFFYISMAYTFP